MVNASIEMRLDFNQMDSWNQLAKVNTILMKGLHVISVYED